VTSTEVPRRRQCCRREISAGKWGGGRDSKPTTRSPAIATVTPRRTFPGRHPYDDVGMHVAMVTTSNVRSRMAVADQRSGSGASCVATDGPAIPGGDSLFGATASNSLSPARPRDLEWGEILATNWEADTLPTELLPLGRRAEARGENLPPQPGDRRGRRPTRRAAASTLARPISITPPKSLRGRSVTLAGRGPQH
jgi:hypothetical protein